MSFIPPERPMASNMLLWTQIEPYLDQVLELDEHGRTAWLGRLAADQPALAETLQRLLARRDALSAHGFLAGQAPLPVQTRHEPLQTGQIVGAYRIERLIGRGGMGEVWLAARHDGRFEAHCALKFLNSEVATSALENRFRREGRLLARLGHPNIARMLDAGTTPDGRQFLVLEYIAGKRIDEYMDSNQLSIHQRVRLFLNVVTAVAHAHGQLIVHRDLKPSNVLVTDDGVVKLLDFGIAKLLSGAQQEGSDLTQHQASVLTPEYAAPEQLLGEPLGTATDTYQLGILLYVLLVGRHPFQTAARGFDRIRLALESVPPASDFASGLARKQLRGDLDSILAKALRGDQAERYSTASALHEDLVRYLEGRPISARAAAVGYRLRKFVRRHVLAVVSSSAAVIGLCAALVFAVHQANVAAAQRDRAVELSERNSAVTDFLEDLISDVAETDAPVQVSEMLRRSEELALANTQYNHENRAAVLGTIATQYFLLGDSSKARQLLDDALQLLQGSTAADLRAELVCGRAVVMDSLGDASLTAAAVRALDAELSRPPSDALIHIKCLYARTQVSTDPKEALQYALAGLERMRTSGLQTPQTEANLLTMLADAYDTNGRYQEALASYRKSVQIFTDLGRANNSDVLVVRNNMALLIETAGMPNRALQIYEELLAIHAKRGHADPPPYTLINRARALECVGRFSESRRAFQRALEVSRAVGRKRSELAALCALAMAAAREQEFAEAQRYVDQAAALIGSAASADQSSRLALARGTLALQMRQYDIAQQQFTLSLQSAEKNEAIDARLGLAQVLLTKGDASAAAAMAREALDRAVALSRGSEYSYWQGRASLQLGLALATLQQHAQARTALVAAVRHLSGTVDPDHPLLLQARRMAGSS